jgi:hypothetical protein
LSRPCVTCANNPKTFGCFNGLSRIHDRDYATSSVPGRER